MVEISTSVLSLKQEDITQNIYDLEIAHTDYFHIDVMDGKFVKQDTFERMKNYIAQITRISSLPIDVHFMVNDVSSYIEEFIPFNPNRITFHYEACENKEEIDHFIHVIKEAGIKVGISIKPDTKVEEISKFLPFVHMVLIMTVEPGKGGQALLPKTLEKIKQLKDDREKQNLDFTIEVDGGISIENIGVVQAKGADIVVVGSAIINTKDYTKAIKQLRKQCRK